MGTSYTRPHCRKFPCTDFFLSVCICHKFLDTELLSQATLLRAGESCPGRPQLPLSRLSALSWRGGRGVPIPIFLCGENVPIITGHVCCETQAWG